MEAFRIRQVSCLGMIADVLFITLRSRTSGADENLFAIASISLSLALLALWIFVIRPSWVRVPAEAYAERLIEPTIGKRGGPFPLRTLRATPQPAHSRM